MLTPKQQKVLSFIEHYQAKKHYAPSLEEIAHALGTTSRGSVLKHVRALEDKGLLTRESGKSRSCQVVQPLPEQAGLPLVGKIAAGQPIAAIENIEYIDLYSFLSPSSKAYLLEVKGDSMMGIGILEGDFVLVEPAQTARNGQVVVAIVDGCEATLKRFRNHGNGTISLLPENHTMSPMVYEADRVAIQGIMIGQIRKYDG